MLHLYKGATLQGGKYIVERVLGQGGFGITYLATHSFLEKQVAIKEFFPKDFCGRDNTSHLTLGTQNNAETVSKLKDRFLKEAKNISRLDHPGIIKIHDIFEENNTAYYVMDYIEGENLNEMVKRDGPLSESKAVEYVRKVGDALDYIHSRNMTHFDVKPANIMVRRSDDQPILIDFGLSKQYDAHGDATSSMMQGVSHGYSPIELYNPGSVTSFSPQTDVYSLGATLYFLLTGTVPPSASNILENGITIPTSISDSNSSAIKAAMSVSRTMRPQQVNTFIDKLSSHPYTYKTTEKKAINTTEETVFINPQPEPEKRPHPIPSPTSSPQPQSKGIGILIVIIIIGVIGVNSIKYNSQNSTEQVNANLKDSDSILNFDIIEEVVAEPVQSHNGLTIISPIINEEVNNMYFENSDMQVLVPKYLGTDYIIESNWRVFQKYGSIFKYGSWESSQSPEEIAHRITKYKNATYTRGLDNWFVKTGISNNYYYYTRVVKIGQTVYAMIYYVPKDDKENSIIYQKLTEKISKNFPLKSY